MIAPLLLAPLMISMAQVGPNPAAGQMPTLPDELVDRSPREGRRLADCLQLAATRPAAALDRAQALREKADSDRELAESAHCAGLALAELGRWDEAQRSFDLASGEALEADLAYAARLSGLAGHAARARGAAAEALALIDRAGGQAISAGARAGPLAAALRVDVAGLLVEAGREADAAAALAEARTADPANGEAWLLSATLERRAERLAEAQRLIETAARLAPRDPRVGLEAGVIAALAGRDADARASFASVVALAPDGPEAAAANAYLAQLEPAE